MVSPYRRWVSVLLPVRPSSQRDTRRGLALCLISGASFGLAAVIAKEAFRSGFNVESLLAGRFALAAIAFWLIVTVRWKVHEPARRPSRPSSRTLVMAVGLGAVGYAFQSAFYFGALTRLNASVVAQLLYIYPALVLVIALLRGRESLEARKIIALLCSALGLVLLLHGGAGAGSMSLAGVLMALGAAGTYALYITVAGGLPDDLDLYLLAAIVCSAATISVAGYAAVTGTLHGPRHASGWLWLLVFAMVPTVVAIVTFLAGLRLVGGSVAAILSCTEPVVTVGSAALVYSERLTLVQILGGVAVLSAVAVLQVRRNGQPAAVATPV
ncbi:MAG: hypothetical protein QOE71_338 [Pseudonocardiales bacterium]|nr:hypothetical protein [Pseudonocardiales bacterium]